MNNEFWAVLVIALTVGWVITTWIRAKHGYPVEDTFGGHVMPARSADSEALSKKVEQALKKQETELVALKERIQVLEQIVTDKSGRLREDIESLNS